MRPKCLHLSGREIMSDVFRAGDADLEPSGALRLTSAIDCCLARLPDAYRR